MANLGGIYFPDEYFNNKANSVIGTVNYGPHHRTYIKSSGLPAMSTMVKVYVDGGFWVNPFTFSTSSLGASVSIDADESTLIPAPLVCSVNNINCYCVAFWGFFNFSEINNYPPTIDIYDEDLSKARAYISYTGQSSSFDLNTYDILNYETAIAVLLKYNLVKGADIIYNQINCVLSGPSSISYNENAYVYIKPNNGYIISNPEQGASISVYDKNGYLPFQYDSDNKCIIFTSR